MITLESIISAYGQAFIGGNRAELLWRGGEAFSRIKDALHEATASICLQVYIFKADHTGDAIGNILIEKARTGVGVFVLYDHLGSFGTPRAFWQKLREAGVHVAASHPFRWHSPGQYAFRDHTKLLVIDGGTAFIGGLNIANEYRGHQPEARIPWRDTGIMVKGPAVAHMAEAFQRAWRTWAKGRLEPAAAPEGSSFGDLPILPVFTRRGRARRRLRMLLYHCFTHAEQSIDITTAYFTPSRHILKSLLLAARGNVRVRLIVPEHGDVTIAHYAGRAYYSRLLNAGAEIYLYVGNMLHAKTYVVDDIFSIVGSANLGYRSLRWNDEGMLGIMDKGFASQMNSILSVDLDSCVRLEGASWKQRPFGQKALEFICSLFRQRI